MIFIDCIPGDKSISHRAVIIASLVKGITQFKGFLCSHDCLATVKIFKQLGVDVRLEGTTLTINGKGSQQLKPSVVPLNVGNSGTGIRLISGVLAASPFHSRISGDESIQRRPMRRIIDPLTEMGAQFISSDGLPPLVIYGTPKLKPGWHYDMPVASAQVKSAVLLAAFTAGVPVSIQEPEPCRDHTERMLRHFGVNIDVQRGLIRLINASSTPVNGPVQIPGDLSSALFFICLGLMLKQQITFKNIGLNPSRTGCLDVLRRMGATIKINTINNSYEPMGDISIEPCSLKNIQLSGPIIPNIIDELPILAVLATTAQGVFSVRNAQELRVKESDRIAGICRLLSKIGANVTEYDDGFDVLGPMDHPKNITFDACYDHRLAMSALIAKTAFNIHATVSGVDSISTSFPNFMDLLHDVSMRTSP
jgi:3-phosphoshikimate 1-carboxyvinyltransferase